MEAILPGEDLIEAGIEDLRAGRETVEALLVAIGAPRLRRIGLELPSGLPATSRTPSLRITCTNRSGLRSLTLQFLN